MEKIDFLFKLELEQFPYAELRKIADLIYFEGPLLSLFSDINGEKYLYYWCDVSDVCNRWLVLRISDKKLDLYLRKKISLRDVIIEPDDGLLHAIDIDQELRLSNVVVVSPKELPESYIPDEDSYYESTPEFMEAETLYDYRHNYKIHLDKRWTLQDLSDLPRVYTQVYSFLYLLHQKSNQYNQIENLNQYVQPIYWPGVINELDLYKYLYNSLDPQHRPTIVSMQYAPPGWIELDLFLPTALSVKVLIEQFVSSFDKMNGLYEGIYRFLTERHLLKPERQSITLDQYAQQMTRESARVLANTINIDYVPPFQNSSQNPLISLNILLGFYGRLKKLAEYQIEGKAEY